VRVLLLQLDGKMPNLALMRLASHHRLAGDEVVLRMACNGPSVQRRLGDDVEFDRVYGSLIFTRTRFLAEAAQAVYPGIVLGGSGWDERATLEDLVGIPAAGPMDYSDYPTWRQSIGFTQRGCRLNCGFCAVPRMEGKVRPQATIQEIWRGDPWPRHVLLLDNDFFGQPRWADRIAELKAGGYKVSFNQGINARMLTDEAAAAIASVDYRDDSMKVKRIYTAWDNQGDEHALFRGLEALVRHGVRPDHVMVYMLIGYGLDTARTREHRRARLREFGARPYPMPFVRTPELLGFQRWVIGAYDKSVPWAEWRRARFEPRNLRLGSTQQSLPDPSVKVWDPESGEWADIKPDPAQDPGSTDPGPVVTGTPVGTFVTRKVEP